MGLQGETEPGKNPGVEKSLIRGRKSRSLPNLRRSAAAAAAATAEAAANNDDHYGDGDDSDTCRFNCVHSDDSSAANSEKRAFDQGNQVKKWLTKKEGYPPVDDICPSKSFEIFFFRSLSDTYIYV